MSIEQWAIVLAVVSITVTVILTAPVLWLTIRQELRARARDDVEWEVDRVEQGVFAVRNTGRDTAHEVHIEAWTSDELEEVAVDQVESKDEVVITLPKRKATGPLPVDHLPPEPYHVPGIANTGMEEHRRWMKQNAEEEQVTVKVVWRGRWGRWRTDSMTTG